MFFTILLTLFGFTMMLQYSALIHNQSHRAKLVELINQKEVVGDLFNQLRLALQRRTKGRPAQVSVHSLFLLVKLTIRCSFNSSIASRNVFIFFCMLSYRCQ